ncbi:hypothetical protein FJY69_08370 [candidate division WOR-3 bacterium]|nr:hypothetical protein [candidate division WOR-3 bacterium]
MNLRRVLPRFQCAQSRTGITAYTGLPVIAQFAESLSLFARIEQGLGFLKRRQRGYEVWSSFQASSCCSSPGVLALAARKRRTTETNSAEPYHPQRRSRRPLKTRRLPQLTRTATTQFVGTHRRASPPIPPRQGRSTTTTLACLRLWGMAVCEYLVLMSSRSRQ